MQNGEAPEVPARSSRLEHMYIAACTAKSTTNRPRLDWVVEEFERALQQEEAKLEQLEVGEADLHLASFLAHTPSTTTYPAGTLAAQPCAELMSAMWRPLSPLPKAKSVVLCR